MKTFQIFKIYFYWNVQRVVLMLIYIAMFIAIFLVFLLFIYSYSQLFHAASGRHIQPLLCHEGSAHPMFFCGYSVLTACHVNFDFHSSNPHPSAPCMRHYRCAVPSRWMHLYFDSVFSSLIIPKRWRCALYLRVFLLCSRSTCQEQQNSNEKRQVRCQFQKRCQENH